MQITSSAFKDGEPIPEMYSREGADLSPPLAIEDAPDGTEAFALIVDDPDAPNKTWVHWLIWNIPGDRKAIPEDVPDTGTVPSLGDADQGTNDFDEIGWGGPMPPEGHGTHHYRFNLYALSRPVHVDPGDDRPAVERALDDVTLATARLTGTYER